MSDIVERLNDFTTRDHERLCQGREYVCSCGYDAELERTVVDAAAEITDLRDRAEAAEAAEWKTKDCFWEIYEDYLSMGGKIKPSADMGENWKARATAAEKERDELKARLDISKYGDDEIDRQEIAASFFSDQMFAGNEEIKRLQGLLAEAKAVLEPFAADWADENGWTDAACQNDRVVDWFGPSDFRAAAALVKKLEKADG